jgi:peptidoglycan hydrolase-like protein with peptidoglycan-binding domain
MINITSNEPILQVQKYLRTLHYETDGIIPSVFPDGVFGPETTAAVKKFQELNNLPITGKIDYDTWKCIYDAYLETVEKKSRPNPLYLFPEDPDYITARGENSDFVAIIQFILRALSDAYECITGLPPSGVYDDATILDITNFQRMCRLPDTGFVDRRTWNKLADTYNRLQRTIK